MHTVTVTNEDASVSSVISMGTLIDVPAIFFSFLQWDVANPRTTKPVSNNLFYFLFARFSQSDLLLTSSDGTVASSKDVERILFHCSSRLVIHYFLSGLTEVFLHVRCIPHQ